MDTIRIAGLEVFANHGVFPEENTLGQRFVVNAALHTDTETAGELDDLDCSIDYSEICGLIWRIVTEENWKLIETVARNIALGILKAYPLVNSVEVEVCKPAAPIPMHFENVSVRIRRGWHTAVIALGSNMGDREAYLRQAVEALEACPEMRDVEVSAFIETAPYGYTAQAPFLNGAVLLQTLYSPHRLLQFMHEIENAAERKREIRWGPRTLDLDLIFYDQEIIADPELNVPHPDMSRRRFVLAPVAEIAPWYLHPLLGKTAAQLLAELEGTP